MAEKDFNVPSMCLGKLHVVANLWMHKGWVLGSSKTSFRLAGIKAEKRSNKHFKHENQPRSRTLKQNTACTAPVSAHLGFGYQKTEPQTHGIPLLTNQGRSQEPTARDQKLHTLFVLWACHFDYFTHHLTNESRRFNLLVHTIVMTSTEGYTTESIVLAIAPKAPALLSLGGSIYIIWSVLSSREKRSNIYHRLMLGLSCSDILASHIYFLGTWLVPRGSSGPFGDVYMAFGTDDSTCSYSGFFNQLAKQLGSDFPPEGKSKEPIPE